MLKKNIQMDLDELLSPWIKYEGKKIALSGLTLDSRNIVQNNLFVALLGAKCDGREFIANAIASGAVAVLCETKISSEHGNISFQYDVPVISYFEPSKILSALSFRFFFFNKKLHKVLGVTGTNGKTTIATLLSNALTLLGHKSAQLGTIGNGVFDELTASLNTTLDPISVCEELANFQQKDVEYTAMEVSSHGLDFGRVDGVLFHSAIFTNLTRDHLDHHGTMEAYADAKKKLFTNFNTKHKIINCDDPVGLAWLKEFDDAISYGFGRNSENPNQKFLQVTKADYFDQGLSFTFSSSWGDGEIKAPFYGSFNVLNIAAVVTQLLAEGFSLSQIEEIAPKLKTVPGRMEPYYFPEQDITFVVDYAHTSDALENALSALKCHRADEKSGRLICVFGCGGDRDTGKRPLMAKAAQEHSDKVVVVDDNVRTEDPVEIVKDILKGFSKDLNPLVIHCREEAINHLLKTSKAGDIILLAGKGHEDYQVIGTKEIHYDEREVLVKLQALYNKDLVKVSNETELS